MNITIVIKQNQGDSATVEEEKFIDLLEKHGHTITLFDVDKMNVSFCNGCWSCWYKTPGKCAHSDDMEALLRSYLKSDLVIHISPLKAGFIDYKLKTINDRSIPLVHPYITLIDGECHHIKRYDHYPKIALLINQKHADPTDMAITKDLYKRMCLNLRSELYHFGLLDEISTTNVEEWGRDFTTIIRTSKKLTLDEVCCN